MSHYKAYANGFGEARKKEFVFFYRALYVELCKRFRYAEQIKAVYFKMVPDACQVRI
jgi:hypothetical protein